MKMDIKANAAKTKLGYMGEIKIYGPDGRLFWTERTKVNRLTKKDAVADAIRAAKELVACYGDEYEPVK